MKIFAGLLLVLSCLFVFTIPVFGSQIPIDVKPAGTKYVADTQVTRAFNTKPFFIVMNTDDRDLAREVLGEKYCVHCSRKVSPVVKNVGFDILYPLSLLLSLLYCLFLALFGYFDSKKDLLL
jgi:hypothetical protein